MIGGGWHHSERDELAGRGRAVCALGGPLAPQILSAVAGADPSRACPE